MRTALSRSRPPGENGTKATASASVDCLPEPEPLDCPVGSEPEPEKKPEPQTTPQKQPTTTTPMTTSSKPEVETSTEPAQDAETLEPGVGFTSEGNAVTRDLLYDKATNKQFVTLETKDGTVFYLVIDYDSPINEEEEQYQTYFLNLVDAADLAALVGEEEAEPEEEAPPLCSWSGSAARWVRLTPPVRSVRQISPPAWEKNRKSRSRNPSRRYSSLRRSRKKVPPAPLPP